MLNPAPTGRNASLTLQDRLKACRSLPSLPSVALEILRLSRREDIGAVDVASVIRKDPALTAKVLKAANSAYFNSGAEVTTVERAVVVTGINVSMSLALSFTFVRSLEKVRARGFDHQAYWRRSALTAVAARAIATLDPQWAHPDELFVPGLLSDIGMLGLSEAAPDLYLPIVHEAGGDHGRLLELEAQRLKMDHAEAGAWMLERWKLPRPFCAAVAGSHNPDRCVEDELEPWVRTVWLASRIADIWCRKDTAQAAAAARDGWVERLQLPEEVFTKVLDRVAADLAPLTASLEIEIESQDEIDTMLEAAREALVSINLKSQIETEEMRARAITDSLTGLPNRASFDEEIRLRFERARDLGRPLSVVIIDIDHFKQINDQHGHMVGDEVLSWVARNLRRVLRGSDYVARYGGEEFVAILSGAGEEAARAVAERMRSAVASEPCPISAGGSVQVTISAGSTTVQPDHPLPTLLELLGAADRCLYAAKRAGRNCIECETLKAA